MFKKKFLSVIFSVLSTITMCGGFLVLDKAEVKEAYCTATSNVSNSLSETTDYGFTYEAPSLTEDDIIENLNEDTNIDDFYTSQGYSFPHYNISSAEDLVLLSEYINYGGQDSNYFSESEEEVFVLTQDIDLSEVMWSPIGNYDNPFKGVFLGNGHTISNISIPYDLIDIKSAGDGLAGTSANIGFFGNVEGGTIIDLNIGGFFCMIDFDYHNMIDFDYHNLNLNMGFLAGHVSSGTNGEIATIFNCTNTVNQIKRKDGDDIDIEDVSEDNYYPIVDEIEGENRGEVRGGLLPDQEFSYSYRKMTLSPTAKTTKGNDIEVVSDFFYYDPYPAYGVSPIKVSPIRGLVYLKGDRCDDIDIEKNSWFERNILGKNISQDDEQDIAYIFEEYDEYYYSNNVIFVYTYNEYFTPVYPEETIEYMENFEVSFTLKKLDWDFSYDQSIYSKYRSGEHIYIPYDQSPAEYFRDVISQYGENIPVSDWGNYIKLFYSPYGNYTKLKGWWNSIYDLETYIDDYISEDLKDVNIDSFTAIKEKVELLEEQFHYRDVDLELSTLESPSMGLEIIENGKNVVDKGQTPNISVNGNQCQIELNITLASGLKSKATWKITYPNGVDAKNGTLAYENDVLKFYFTLGEECFNYAYKISLSVDNNYIAVMSDPQKGYSGTKAISEAQEWNNSATRWQTENLSGLNLIFQNSKDLAWDGTYLSQTENSEEKLFDDSQEYTTLCGVLVEKKSARIEVSYIDFDTNNPIAVDSEKLGDLEINGVFFKGSNENTLVPLWKNTDFLTDSIKFGRNGWYKAKSFVVKRGTSENTYNFVNGENFDYNSEIDFLTVQSEAGGGENAETYITILLERQKYSYEHILSSSEKFLGIGDLNINGISEFYSVEKTYTLDGNQVNPSTIGNETNCYPWGTQLDLTLNFTDIGYNLFDIENFIISDSNDCAKPKNQLVENKAIKLRYVFDELNQIPKISLPQRVFRILLSEYSDEAGNKEEIDYTNQNLICYGFTLPTKEDNPNFVDTSKAFTADGKLNFDNISLEVIASSHEDALLSGYDFYDFSSGLYIPDYLYPTGYYLVSENDTLLSDTSAETFKDNSVIIQALFSQTNFESISGNAPLIRIGVLTKNRKINVKVDFQNTDGAIIKKIVDGNYVNLSSCEDNIGDINYFDSSNILLPKYSWTGHKITNFSYNGENKLSRYDASLDQFIEITQAEKELLFGTSTLLNSQYFKRWTSVLEPSTQSSQTKNITINAVWERNSYRINIDDAVMVIQINDKILLDSDKDLLGQDNFIKQNIANVSDRNGQALYKIFSLPSEKDAVYPKTETATIKGNQNLGYNVTGFALYSNADDKYGEFSYNQELVFTEEIIKLIQESQSGEILTANVKTLREKATYKIYIQTSEYYNIQRLASKDINRGVGEVFKTNGLSGEDNDGIFVYGQLNETLSPFVQNFAPDLNQALVVSRIGYSLSGWTSLDENYLSEDGLLLGCGDKKLLKPLFELDDLSDESFKLSLEWNSKTPSGAKSTEDCKGIENGQEYLVVYALRDFEIIDILVSGNLIQTEDISTPYLIGNGDNVKKQQIIVQKYTESGWENSWIYRSEEHNDKFLLSFNYNQTPKFGTYRIQYFYTLKDMVSGENGQERVVESNKLYYKVEKNRLVSDSLQTIYSPDGKIFGNNLSGNVGTLFQWAWTGGSDAETNINIKSLGLSENDMMLAEGEVFEAGSTKKSILLLAEKIKKSLFSLEEDVEISDVLETSQVNGKIYVKLFAGQGTGPVPATSGLVINKASIDIHFGTVYGFERFDENGNVVVRQNVTKDYGIVTYSYSLLTLNNYSSDREAYLVGDGFSEFSVTGFEVYYPKNNLTSEAKVTENYNVVLKSGTFKVVSPENTLKFEIKTQGLSINNQQLIGRNDNLTLALFDPNEKVIVKFSVDGRKINLIDVYEEITEEEGVLFFIEKNSGGDFDVYINSLHSQANALIIKAHFSVKEEYSSQYGIIGATTSYCNNTANLTWANPLDMGIGQFREGQTIDFSKNSASESYYPVISNVTYAKILNIYDESLSQRAYLIAGDESFNIGTPQSGYTHAVLKYLKLDRLSDQTLTIQTSLVGENNQTNLTLNKICQPLTLTPIFELTGYQATYTKEIENKTLKALPNAELVISKYDIFGEINEESSPWGEKDVEVDSIRVWRDNKGENEQSPICSGDDVYLFNKLNSQIFAPTTLGGEWKAEITYVYEGKTTKNNFTFTLTVNPQPWANMTLSPREREYNGQSLNKNDIRLDVKMQGQQNTQNCSLADVASQLKLKSTLYYSEKAQGQKNQVSNVLDVGIYTIEFEVQPGYENIWDLSQIDEDDNLTLSIIPFNIKNGNWQITKIMSTDDNLTCQHFVIETGEILTLTFERENGESVGQYDFTSVSIDNEHKKNYTITGNLGRLIIKEPSGYYNIERLTSGDFSLVYDATNLANDELSLVFKETKSNNKNVFTLSVNHNGQIASLDVEIFYWDTDNGQRVEVPSDTSFTLSFESVGKNVGEYDIIVKIAEKEFSNESIALTINPKEVSVTTIEKDFDGNTSLYGALIEFGGFIGTESATLQGEFASPLVGSWGINLVSLEGNENYVLASGPIYGTIKKASIEDISGEILSSRDIYYGELTQNSTYQDVSRLITLDFEINSIAGVLENGYVSVDDILFDDTSISNSNHIKADEVLFKLTLQSDNFDGLEGREFSFYMNIKQKELDFSTIIIQKEYDGDYLSTDKSPTPNMPSVLPSIDWLLLTGDEVCISSRSLFDISNNFLFGNCGFDSLLLDGEDKDNYKVSSLPKGKINPYDVDMTLQVVETGFVDDGENIYKPRDSYQFIFPFADESALNQIYEDIQLYTPLRTGYEAKWYFSDMTTQVENNADFVSELVSFAISENRQGSLVAQWEIVSYLLNIDFPSDIAQVTPTNGTRLNYWQDVTISVQAEEGYKLDNVIENNTRYDRTLSQPLRTGKNYTEGVYAKITGDLSLELIFGQINITFDVLPSLPMVNGQTLARTDFAQTMVTYPYQTLASLYKNSLSHYTLISGTFIHTDYEYLLPSGRKEKIGAKNLANVVAEMLTNVEQDTTLTLDAVWEGEDYIISFDLNSGGNVTTPGTISDLEIKFGQILPNLPIATMQGRQIKAWSVGGEILMAGKQLGIIGIEQDGKFRLTAVAQWEGSKFTLKIEKGEYVTSITQKGIEVEDNGEFVLIFGETELVFSVSVEDGYYISANSDRFVGHIEQVDGQVGVFKIKNLTQNSVIKFLALPNENLLIIRSEHYQTLSVKTESGVEINEETDGGYIIETGVQAVITIVSERGYVFNSTTQPALTGYGQILIDSITEERTIILKWMNFVGGATLDINPVARKNNITIKSNSKFESVSFDGGVNFVSLENDVTSVIETGLSKEIVLKLHYGFKQPLLNGIDIENLNNLSTTWVDEEKIYKLSAVLVNCVEDKQIVLDAVAREYTFNISIVSGMASFSSLNVDEVQTIAFGQTLNFGIDITNIAYGFVNWKIFDRIFTTEKDVDILIDENIKGFLEIGEHREENNIIPVIAVVKELTTSITFKNLGRGQIQFDHIDIADDSALKSVTLLENAEVLKKLKLDDKITIQLNPNQGYHFSGLIVNDEDVNFQNNDFGITLDGNQIEFIVASSLHTMQFIFEADIFNISVKAVVEVLHSLSSPTNAGGQIFPCDVDGNILDNYCEDSVGIGFDFLVESHTDDEMYFLVEPKNGFTSVVTVENSKVSKITTDKIIYRLTQIKAGASLLCTFIAKTNYISVKFVTDGTTNVAMAGRFVADTSSLLVYSQINNSYSVSLGALTNAQIFVTGYVNANYDLQMIGNKPKTKIVYSSGKTDSGDFVVGGVNKSDYSITGFTNNFSFSLSNINENATIYVYVSPKIYNLALFVDEGEIIEIENGIVFGQEISLVQLSESQKALAFKQKANYDHGGYYTMQLGQGTKYITAEGRAVKAWTETGYIYDGVQYKSTPNYNPETNTFTVYAFWQYKKAYINLEIVPTRLKNYELSQFKVADFVSKGFGEALGWIDGEDKLYAEIMCGKSLTLTAVQINGYVFEKWIVSYNAEIQESTSLNWEYHFENYDYTITIVYRPTYSLTPYCENNDSVEGGSTFMLQDDIELDGTSFSSEKSIKLVAEPGDGYEFLYFKNTKNGVKYPAELINGKYYCSLSPQNTPLVLVAVFKGKSVVANVDLREIVSRHNLVGIYINDVKKNLIENKFSSSDVHVGDKVVVKIQKEVGYKIQSDFDFFDLSVDSTLGKRSDVYTFTYKVTLDSLEIQEDKLSFNAKFTAPQESINITLVNGVEEDGMLKAESVGGKVAIFIDGKEEELVGTRQIEFLFEDTVTLEILAFENYKLAYFMVNDNKVDLTEFMRGNSFIIDKEFVSKFYYERQISLEICFKAMTWDDEESRSVNLRGEGTKENPYLVSSARDFGFISYAVKNGIVNDFGVKYADAYYKVTKNINFDGKFWTPIGQNDAFNGTFDLGSFNYSNIILDKSYINPTTSYRGLFLNLTEDAVVLKDNSKTIIISGILIGIAVSSLLIVLIVWTIRRKRQKEYSEKISKY